ncbi:MAG: hypothetical protein DWQ11_09245 [Proteobacteria bacterium]|nr:MAG: hypothetical protein DWQ11_09245 [Pseudomonadota bacterium]
MRIARARSRHRPGLARGAWLALGAAALVAGCSVPLPRPDTTPDVPITTPTPQPELRELPPEPLAATPPAPPAPRSGRPRRAMSAEPIELAMRCAARDERRHTVQADVEVRDGRVRYLRARVAQPRGACEFALPDFEQTRVLPSIELLARDGSGCRLLLWEQGPQVVLGYDNCAQYCQPQTVFSDALPILFDLRVGRCD